MRSVAPAGELRRARPTGAAPARPIAASRSGEVRGRRAVEREQGGERHAGEARRHGEALVVGRSRHEQHSARPRGRRAAGPAGRSALQVRTRWCTSVEQLVGQLDRGDALGAVPGPRERDQQRRDVLARGSSRGLATRSVVGTASTRRPERAAQTGRQDLAGERRRARAGQHDPRRPASRAAGRGSSRTGRVDALTDPTPHLRLLGDLRGRVRRTAAEVGRWRTGRVIDGASSEVRSVVQAAA